MISAKVVAQTHNLDARTLITTVVLRYPLIIHAELMTHRMFSRNAASQRAVPCKTIRRNVLRDPFIPTYIGANKKGMQAGEELKGWRRKLTEVLWGGSRYPVIAIHWLLEKLGVHKQITNRLLIPWQWMETVVTSTEWDNFFRQRLDKGTEPHFQELAKVLKKAMWHFFVTEVTECKAGAIHIPFITDEERKVLTTDIMMQVSAARCARVSYFLPGTDKVSDVQADLALCEKLMTSGHWSPFEHVATAISVPAFIGNLKGFRSFRKDLENV